MKKTKPLPILWFWPLVFAACGGPSATEGGGSTTPDKKTETLILQPSRLSGTLELPGELLPFEAVDIYTRANGFVKNVLVDRGSVVVKGEVLAVVEAPELLAALAEARARAGSAESRASQKKTAYGMSNDTYSRLLKTSGVAGAVSDNELLGAKARQEEDSLAHAAALRELAANLAAVEVQEKLVSFLNVTAPFAGTITERLVHPGALPKKLTASPSSALKTYRHCGSNWPCPKPM